MNKRHLGQQTAPFFWLDNNWSTQLW